MKYNGPKVRLSRALGLALTPKAARIMEKRPYPPGQQGPNRRRRRPSGYKEQLVEKQRLRAQYNVHERQMKTYFKRSMQKKGNTADNLVAMLETRLDAVVLRGGFARSIYAARQYVGHGHFEVNGRKVDVPSYRVRPGDLVRVRPSSQKILCFRDAIQSSTGHPDYLSVDIDKMTIQFERMPERSEVPVICDLSKVIEFYSR
ncbi:MAG: 30S ribosomal protein S4 [Acidobacteriota bacterium]